MTKQIPFNDLGLQDQPVRDQIERAISRVISSSSFVKGQDIDVFEKGFGDYCAAHCAAVGNGTDAIELALRALGIGVGDEVIAPANTFIATVEAILNTGARAILVDCDSATYNIDAARLEEAISPRTRAIIAVHLYGQPADFDEIANVANRHGLAIIEDAAQAHGAYYKGRRVGTLGQLAAFSFFPGKNLGAYGDAGAVVGSEESLVRKVRQLRDHGRDPGEKFDHGLVGRNSRMDTIQAAILSCKLPLLDSWNERRRSIAKQYDALLADAVHVTKIIEGVQPVYHLYVVEVDQRDKVRDRLSKAGIATGIHYPVPVHLHSGMSCLGYSKGAFPVSEAAAHRILSLPLYTEMTMDQVEHVARTLKEIVKVT